MYVSTVYAIQTKGRASAGQWIEAFRLEYSKDCVFFKTLSDVNGNNYVRNIFFCLRISKLFICEQNNYLNHIFVFLS